MDELQPGLVSVMMPAYNAEQFIRQAIESVFAQNYSAWELIVVNDGSTDHTAEIVLEYSDARVRLIHQDNQGEAAARNTALRVVRGEYLAFLDADDQFLPGHLASAVHFFAGFEEMDGLCTDGYYVNTEGETLQSLASRRRGPYEGDIFEETVYSSNVIGPPVSVVLRTAPILENGLRFDEDITIGPDWDFFTRYAEIAKFGFINQYTCLYRIHSTNITFRIDLKKRNLELVKCRVNAIELNRFGACSHRIRGYVFYDLLVNLLQGFPERQSQVTTWQQFKALTPATQARLFRLMASTGIVSDVAEEYIEQWIDQARERNPSDLKAFVLSLLYKFNHSILKFVLRMRFRRRVNNESGYPFADLNISKPA